MADEIIVETTSTQVIEVSSPGPQGPAGAAGSGLETLTQKGDTLYRGETTGERLPIGTTGQILRVSASGIPEWGAAPASGVSSVNGQTGSVTITAASIDAANDNHAHNFSDINVNGVLISGAGNANANGPYLYSGDFGDRGAYHKDKDSVIYWDGSAWLINVNGSDCYSSTQNVSFPYQVTSWSVLPGSGTAPAPTSNARLSGQEFEEIVGQRVNPTLRGDAAGKNVGTGANDVAAGNHTHSAATQSVAGFLSAADKTKLDGIASGATAVTASNAAPSALGVAAAGTSANFARADHVHAMPTAGQVGAAPATFAAEAADKALALFDSPAGANALSISDDVVTIAPDAVGSFCTALGLVKPASGNASSTQVVLGNDSRLSDSRSPSAHSSSHAAGGSDPLAPSDIGAQSIFSVESLVITTTAQVTLTAARAKIYDIVQYAGAAVDVKLPSTNAIQGDVVVLRWGTGSNTVNVVQSNSPAVITTVSSGEQKRFIRGSTDSWSLVPVDTHTHNASAITSGTLDIARIPTGTSSTQVSLGDHVHGNLTSDGKIGSTSGLPVVTTTAGAVSTLALGAAGTVLTVNSGATGVEFAAASGGGVTGAAASASDVLGVSGANITGVDATADRIVFWDDSANKLTYLAAGSGLSISGTTLTATGTIGGSTSTDNAIVRADSTSNTVQDSALVIDDAITPFNITADAATDVITAVGHNFTTNQGIRFTSLTGGTGLSTTTNYFVRDISGDTFKVSTTSGGSAVNITTSYSAGTVVAMQPNVAIRNTSSETNSALVLTPKGTGAFILGPKPDGTATGGNIRGAGAVDLLLTRLGSSQQNQVASGDASLLAGIASVASGRASVAIGELCTASGTSSACFGGNGSFSTTASATNSIAYGFTANADRQGMHAHAHGRFSANGDAQRARFVLRCKTTNATATELFIDGSSVRLTIPSGKVIAAIVHVVGVKSDGTACSQYIREVCAKNVAGTSSLVGTVTTIGTDQEDSASTDVSITVSDANDAIQISVTGIASETWRWVASVDAVEVAYGT